MIVQQQIQDRLSTPFTEVCLYFAQTLLTFASIAFVLDSLTLICGGSISAWQGWAGLVLSILYGAIQLKLRSVISQRQIWIITTIALGFIGLSLLVSGYIHDTSWDGQTYHQEAILQLSQGWNPFHRLLADSVEHSLWLNHYPKAAWLLAANLFQMTHRLETAKAFNFIFLFCSFFLTLAVIQSTTSLDKLQASAIAALFALNPIVITQLFNFTIDGQVASLILTLGGAIYLICARVTTLHTSILIAVFSSILLINLKFTGLVYVVIFLCGAIAWLVYKHHQALYSFAAISVLCVLVSIGGLGFNPYISNILSHGNPFYPLAGNHKIDIISPQMPVKFAGKNSIEKLILSTFATTDDALNTNVHLKMPFFVQRKEIGATGRGARVGGFGPLFSGAVCVSIIVLFFGSFTQFQLGYFAAFLILASIVINPEAWCARYVPQAWLLMPLGILPGFSKAKSIPRRKLLRFCSYALMLVLAANCSMAALPYTYQSIRATQTVKQQLRQISKTETRSISIQFNSFRGIRQRLTEAGVVWTEVTAKHALPCDSPLHFVSSKAQFCPVPQSTGVK